MFKDNGLIIHLLSKIDKDPGYLAWYFQQYRTEEQLSEEDLANCLGIDKTKFYSLAMCKAPDGQSPDFAQRLKAIADFAGANQFLLAQIIRSVNSLTSLRADNADSFNALMAAREKLEDKDNANQEKENE